MASVSGQQPAHLLLYPYILIDLYPAIDNTDALTKYYRLLLSVVRVLAAVVLSRGPQNQQTMEQAKLFLTENRPIVVAVFKRQARIGSPSVAEGSSSTVDVEELAELLVLLMTVTGFIDVSGRICFFPYPRD